VGTQIMRYESAQRAGRTVPLSEVVNLIQLVLRRPDAEAILHEAGQRIARWRFRRVPHLWTRLLRRGPGALALRSARAAATATLRSLRAGSSVHAARPFTLSVTGCISAGLGDGGSGCALFTGLLEEQLLLYTGRPHRVTHAACAANGAGDTCEWRLPAGLGRQSSSS
jgi:predicted hydrocarbon binding protein